MAEYFDALARCNSILIDLCRDFWGYISVGYFRQKVVAGEVGSSTMPHKVNPIDFENAEGNLGRRERAAALHVGQAAGLALAARPDGLDRAAQHRRRARALGHRGAVDRRAASRGSKSTASASPTTSTANWELLAEPIQTVMRRYAVPDAYEQLKALTRGTQRRRRGHRGVRRAACRFPQRKGAAARTHARHTSASARLAREV